MAENASKTLSKTRGGIKVNVRHNRPAEFQWKARWHSVTSIQEYWVDTGEWWMGEGEKIFYRLLSGFKIYELYYDRQFKCWGMYRIYD